MSKPQFFAFSIFVFSLIVCNEASRILVVVPTSAISHQAVFRPLTQELARRGHEVVVATADPAFPKGKSPPNLMEIDLHNVSYSYWAEFKTLMPVGRKQPMITHMTETFTIFGNMFCRQLTDEIFFKLIQDKKQHFDLLILEAWVRPTLALSHVFKAPVIRMSSFGAMFDNYDIIGAPSRPLLYPVFTRQRLYNLSMWEKVKEFYNNYKLESALYADDKKNEEFLRTIVGPDMPSLKELSNNVDMLFLNWHPLWDSNRPVPPGVVYIGGIHEKPEKELPKDLKAYLDSSVHGVIYISFGTTVPTESIPKEMIQNVIKVVSQLPYDILWKWDQDELPGRSPNIRISKWLPQSDLLRHPKIKLFIMQGGLQSTDEAINAGVPMIAFPLIGDQWYNAEKFVYHKIGFKLDIEEFTADDLKSAIKTIIEDDSYRRNIVKLGELMHDQPQKPLERAVWWIEHALRHAGARHLRAPAANITWTQYLELHLVLTLVLALIVSITLFLLIVKYIFKCLFGKTNNAKKNN